MYCKILNIINFNFSGRGSYQRWREKVGGLKRRKSELEKLVAQAKEGERNNSEDRLMWGDSLA